MFAIWQTYHEEESCLWCEILQTKLKKKWGGIKQKEEKRLSRDSQNLIFTRIIRRIWYHFISGASPGSTLKTHVVEAEKAIALRLPWQLRYRCVLHHVSSQGNGLHPANQRGTLGTLTWLGLNFPWESTFAVLTPAADRKHSHCLLVDQSWFIFLSSHTEIVPLNISGSSRTINKEHESSEISSELTNPLQVIGGTFTFLDLFFFFFSESEKQGTTAEK